MKLNTNRVVGLYAPQNSGKTHLASWLVSLVPTNIPVYVYDTNFERLTAYPQNTRNIKFIRSPNPSDQENPAFLDMAILHLRSKSSNFFIVIEDIDKIVSATKSIETSELFKLASDSRHQRIGIIYATKEPTNIPKILRSNTNLYFIGNFIEPQNVKTLTQIVDKATLTHLKQRQFIMLDRFDNTTTNVELVGNMLTKIEVDINAPPVSKQSATETEKGDVPADDSGRARAEQVGQPTTDTTDEGRRSPEPTSVKQRQSRGNTVPTKPKGKGRAVGKTKQRQEPVVLPEKQGKGIRKAARKEGTGKEGSTGKEAKRGV